jgi:hypothetical protein
MIRLRAIAAAALLLALSGLSADSLAQGGCVSQGEGQQMVAQGQVLPLPAALQNAGLGGAQVIDVQLCHAGGGWAYRVRYNQGGQVSTANVPAG